MNENTNAKELAIPYGLQQNIDLLDSVLSGDKALKGKIVDVLEAYLFDDMWPANMRELDRTLDLLSPNLSALLKNILVNTMSLFERHSDILPPALNAFLQEMQAKYAYKYKIGVYRTTLSTDRFYWYTININKFSKRGQDSYGVNIVRNDGETIYFEGTHETLNKLIGIIQEVMNSDAEVEQANESEEA